MSEVNIKTENKEQKLFQARAFCPDCEVGYLVATGRVGSEIQGAPPRYEHICTNCEKVFGLDQPFPAQYTKDTELKEGEESDFEQQVKTLRDKHADSSSSGSGLILPR